MSFGCHGVKFRILARSILKSLYFLLINRQQQQVEIYRPNREVEILQTPQTLSGEDVLPGFVLDLVQIW